MIGMVAMGKTEGVMDDCKLAHMEALVNSITLFAIAGCLQMIESAVVCSPLPGEQADTEIQA